MRKLFIISLLFVSNLICLYAEKPGTASIKGVIVEKSTEKPLEFAYTLVKNIKDTSIFQGGMTDKNGKFSFENLPYGEYKLSYSFIGFDKVELPLLALNSNQNKVDVGKLYISETVNNLEEVQIVGQKSTYVASTDRKTFYVGQDLMSKTGSVSELMQNIPSVQVDLDGNVALRGSDNVMILINGRPSALMGANRAAVLQQMPANSIEKIEVITNPSAKYKPDGTSGIINIVLKKDRTLGFNGTASVNAGNDERYNTSISTNYNPGKLNIFGMYSLRQDDRLRYSKNYTTRYKNTDSASYINIDGTDKSRPFSHIGNWGAEYKINDNNKIGVSGNFNYRSFTKYSTDIHLNQNSDLSISKSYDRILRRPEHQSDLEYNAFLNHSFEKEGHELNFDFTSSKSDEVEDNHFKDAYRIPSVDTTFDNELIKQKENATEFTIEYINPITDDITFESGYIFEKNIGDMDYYGELFNSNSNSWEKDFIKSNHFIYTQNVHVIYSTYEQKIDKFSFLTGLRAEQAFINANQITTDSIDDNKYFRLYPSLHMSYDFTDEHELQLNYSHRINRPEGDDVNPFPEYQDAYNLRIGNPKLKPADIHSIETGYQFKKNKTTILSTLYYRYTYNGMTDITKFINDSVRVTSKENLAKSDFTGLELVISSSIGNFVNFNLSPNVFYNTIDASNLGYSKNKSIISWRANFNSSFNITKSTVFQITSNYTAERLIPQGTQLPLFVMNMGFRQEVLNKKGAFIVTVSDVFNTMKEAGIRDTPEIYQETSRTRSARMIYAGFTYSFGNNKKKEKDNSIKFDNQL